MKLPRDRESSESSRGSRKFEKVRESSRKLEKQGSRKSEKEGSRKLEKEGSRKNDFSGETSNLKHYYVLEASKFTFLSKCSTHGYHILSHNCILKPQSAVVFEG